MKKVRPRKRRQAPPPPGGPGAPRLSIRASGEAPEAFWQFFWFSNFLIPHV